MEYRGLERIAERMGISRCTLIGWHERLGFLMYQRRIGPRNLWVTDDALIAAWLTARCRADHQAKYRDGRRLNAGRSAGMLSNTAGPDA